MTRDTARTIAAILVASGLAFTCAASAQDANANPNPLRRAVASLVLERMGRDASVDVRGFTPDWDESFVKVSIDPSARIGGAVWITIFTGPAKSSRVRAEVAVVVDYVCASRPLSAGQAITAEDLTPVRGAVTGVPFRRLPTMVDLVGGRALRSLAASEVIQSGFIQAVPLVRAGQAITATAHIGMVEVSSTFTAVDNGAKDDVIRIVNPETKRTLRARVVGTGLVEVIDVQ